LKKIKIISFETFLNLKELLREFDQSVVAKPEHRFNKPPALNEKRNVNIQLYSHIYEPTQIINTRNSLFWQWRRVIAWERYINDPLEKIKIGTM